MTIEIRDIAQMRKRVLDGKEDKPPRYRAVIVKQRDSSGNESIHPEGRSQWHVWVRLWASNGSILPAFNDKAPAVDGMPVYVTRKPGTYFELEVEGVDKEAIENSDPFIKWTMINEHREQHEWLDGIPGIDPLTIYPRALSMLRTYSTDPASLEVHVSPLIYYDSHDSQEITFDGGTLDLTASVPGAANQARLVLVYLDSSTNVLGSTDGDIGPSADGWFLSRPSIADGQYPSALVRLENGQTSINETDIRDRRTVLSAIGLEGWPYDAIISVSAANSMADYVSPQLAIAGAAAGQSVLSEPGTFVGAATITNGVNLFGIDRVNLIITQSAVQTTITVPGTSLISNCDVRNTRNVDNDNIRAITTNGSSLLLLQHARLYANNASTTNAYAYALYANGTVFATDCKFEAICGYSDITVAVCAGSGGVVHLDASCRCNGTDFDVYAASGGTIRLNGCVLENGTIGGAGTITGWWRDTSGNLYSRNALIDLQGVADALVLDSDGDTTMSAPTDDQIDVEVGGTDRARWLTVGLRFTTGHDCYPEEDGRGIAKRFIWPVTDLTDHFRSGVIPTGYSWLNAGTLDGVAAATPSTIVYSNAYDYLYATPAAATRSFLYKSASVDVLGKSFYARIKGRFTSQAGIRIDLNSDNDFYEGTIRAYSTYVECELHYKVGGGATTTTATTLVLPIMPFYTMRLFIYNAGANQRAFWYIVDETGDVTAMLSTPGEAYWGTATVRAGLLLRVASIAHLFDAFYNGVT